MRGSLGTKDATGLWNLCAPPSPQSANNQGRNKNGPKARIESPQAVCLHASFAIIEARLFGAQVRRYRQKVGRAEENEGDAMNYTGRELQEILDRREDVDRGAYAIGLALAALSGFVTCMILFGGALAMGWLP